MLRRMLLRAGQLKPQARAGSSVPPPSYTQLQAASPAISPQAAQPAAPQAPNSPTPWSTSQRPRPAPASEPRFVQTDMDLQPAPLSAMELINNEPVRLVEGRRAVCDGGTPFFRVLGSHVLTAALSYEGGGPLGHPKIFINLVRAQRGSTDETYERMIKPHLL
jgi:NADH dehydrogenase (ubiquinone) Fe-S protein 6